MKILIIQTAFIGDVILATPVISELSRCKPGVRLDVLVRKGNEGLLLNFPGIRQVITWDKKEGKYRTLWRLLQRIRSEQYDKVINLQRFGATGFLTAFSGAPTTIGFDKNPFAGLYTKAVPHAISGGNHYVHETTRNLLLIQDFGARQTARPALYPSAADFDSVKHYQQQSYCCIAPTSVWFTKQVPAEKWQELIHALRRKGFTGKIYLLGGPTDREACSQLKENCRDEGVVPLAGTLSFLQTAALMKGAVMNYVNDSAPLHIASAMNAPVTAFFCSTIPGFGFGPLSDVQFIVENENLHCRPCGLHGYRTCPKQHFRCANDLNMEQAANNLAHD